MTASVYEALTGRAPARASVVGRMASLTRTQRAFLAALLRVVLVILGLTLFTIAAFTVAVWLGLAVAGLACLSLEWWVKR